MQVHRREKARLRRVCVDPSEGTRALSGAIVPDLILVRGGARVTRTRLGGQQESVGTQLAVHDRAYQDPASLDVPCRVGCGEPLEGADERLGDQQRPEVRADTGGVAVRAAGGAELGTDVTRRRGCPRWIPGKGRRCAAATTTEWRGAAREQGGARDGARR